MPSKGSAANTLAESLSSELERRRRRNGRYSLRAFARDVAIDHSTLSKILRGRRPPGKRDALRAGTRLGWSVEEIGSAVAARATPGEALLILLSLPGGFRTDSRWLASALGVTVDTVNHTLSELARTGRLRMTHRDRWVRGRTRRAAQTKGETQWADPVTQFQILREGPRARGRVLREAFRLDGGR